MSYTYRSCKLLIERKAYESKEAMQEKLDVFYAFNRLTSTEYEELSGLLNFKEVK